MTHSPAPAPAGASERASHGAPVRDYYGLGDVDETGERWFRWIPAMRLYGPLVLAAAAITAFPRDGVAGWRQLVAAVGLASLAVAFALMWVRQPIWHYPTRVLFFHGIFLVVWYTILVAVSPSFAVLGLLIYPQVVFSLETRWSVLGGMYLGLVTGLAVLARERDLQVAAPAIVTNLLIAAMVVAIAIWIRETITESLERRQLIDQLEAARLELAAAERKAGAAEQRARLARDIHDTLAPGFASVVTHLEAADASLAADPDRARDDLRAAEEVARASLGEARTLVWTLRPETIASAGLPAAIERVAGAAGPGGSVRPSIEVTVSGPVRQLHPEVEVTLLRAAQEALANARRHAGASRIAVTLTYFADEVSLDVIDDGCGFDPAAMPPGGMGLLGMRERAERLGGRVSIESTPGEGTAIAVSLPAIEPPIAGAPAARTRSEQ